MQLGKIISRINATPKLNDALEFVQKNSTGNIWIIGSLIYRNMINEIYGMSLEIKDFDFIVEKIEPSILPSADIKMELNNYGNLKIKGSLGKIDIVPITNIHSIKRRNLSPNIENYLSGTPLGVQSVIFNTKDQKIIGEKSIESILKKEVAINNFEEAYHQAYLMNMTVNQYVKNSADRLGFTAKLPLE